MPWRRAALGEIKRETQPCETMASRREVSRVGLSNWLDAGDGHLLAMDVQHGRQHRRICAANHARQRAALSRGHDYAEWC